MRFSTYLLPLALSMVVLFSLWVTWPGFRARARRPAWQQWLRWLIFVVNLLSGALVLYLLAGIYLPQH